jgi:hypothetical protein
MRSERRFLRVGLDRTSLRVLGALTVWSALHASLATAPVRADEPKPAEAKPAEVKPAESKPAEAKPDEAKPEEAKPAGVRRAMLVCGLPGDDEHRTLYAGAIEKIYKALTEKYAFPPAEILVRFGTESKPDDGPALKASRGLSNREGITADAAELRRRLKPDDSLWVIVVGHGHLDGRHAHLNIPGPDIDDRSFGKLFEGLEARDQLFMITTSASGFFLKPLARPGRIVITATEADQEVNETLFPLALADVLAEPPEGIDRDKDGSLTVFELYLAIVADVMQRYVSDENLPTEHAKLDDNGDGRGSEVQEPYLAPELGGRAGKGPEPKLGARDDGALSSKTLVGKLAVPKPEASETDKAKETEKKK